MLLQRFEIREKQRPFPISIAAATDFVVEPAGEVTDTELIEDPRYSLYCLDPDNDRAIFVQCPDSVVVDRAVFLYVTQSEHATHTVSVPLEEFQQLAERIDLPRRGFIFVHSVGRCGSTLLSKVLQAVPSIHSLSEPDDLTQLGDLYAKEVSDHGYVGRLLEAGVRWRAKPREGDAPEFVALKTRSEALVMADLFATQFPQDKHFFLYRDGLAWMRTIFRGWRPDRNLYDWEDNAGMKKSWSRTVPALREEPWASMRMNPIQIRIFGWILCMEGYLQLADHRVPLAAARFEDLCANPKPVLEQFFKFCGIEGVDWLAIEEVLGKDAQAGSPYSQEERYKKSNELTPELVQDVQDTIAARPRLGGPAVRLPGTLAP